MKIEIKEKWLDALRSGEYKQGTKKLRTRFDEYCCLGVLCDIYNKETREGSWRESDFSYEFINEGKPNVTIYLPSYIAKWAGLSETDPRIKSKGNQPISHINDKGTSFNEIAELIEKEL